MALCLLSPRANFAVCTLTEKYKVCFVIPRTQVNALQTNQVGHLDLYSSRCSTLLSGVYILFTLSCSFSNLRVLTSCVLVLSFEARVSLLLYNQGKDNRHALS